MFRSDHLSNVGFPVNRTDGYEQRIATIVCQFQQSVERAADCNYDALRVTLHWARQTYLPITAATLRAAYHIAYRPSFVDYGN